MKTGMDPAICSQLNELVEARMGLYLPQERWRDLDHKTCASAQAMRPVPEPTISVSNDTPAAPEQELTPSPTLPQPDPYKEATKRFANVLMPQHAQDAILPESEGITVGRLAEVVTAVI